MADSERVRAGLRPLPFRGDLIAAGAVPLALGAGLVWARMDEHWAAFPRFLVVALPAALLLVLAWRAPRELEAPRGYVSVLLASAFPLAGVALAQLGAVLGGHGGIGTAVWAALALGGGYAVLAVTRNSAICTLLGAVTLIAAVLAAWQWLFEPGSDTPLRWLLLAAIVACGLGAAVLRDQRRAHAVALIDTAGVAALTLGLSATLGLALRELSGDGSAPGGLGVGWQLVLLLVGFGLVGYGSVDRERGPAWLGAGVLLVFAATASLEHSLLWWPVLLLVLGAAVIAAGLRPTTPAPPAPDADAPPAQPRPFRR